MVWGPTASARGLGGLRVEEQAFGFGIVRFLGLIYAFCKGKGCLEIESWTSSFMLPWRELCVDWGSGVDNRSRKGPSKVEST